MDTQAQQVRQMTGIGFVVTMFETSVLRHGRGVRQLHPIAMIHQAIDEPVPVVRRLDRDAGQVIAKGFDLPENRGQFVGQSSLA